MAEKLAQVIADISLRSVLKNWEPGMKKNDAISKRLELHLLQPSTYSQTNHFYKAEFEKYFSHYIEAYSLNRPRKNAQYSVLKA